MMAFLFAHAFRTIGEPSSYLYPLISAFLLRRPTMDFRDVPMLYDMLYAAGQGSKRERRWMVRFLRDSLRSRSVSIFSDMRHSGLVKVANEILVTAGLANLPEASYFCSSGIHLPVLDRVQFAFVDHPNPAGHDRYSGGFYLSCRERRLSRVARDGLSKRSIDRQRSDPGRCHGYTRKRSHGAGPKGYVQVQ